MDLSAIILAAGQGSRAGGYKPLWPLRDSLVIDRIIRTAFVVCSEVIVVGGAFYGALRDHLAACQPAVKLIRNHAWKSKEMFSSVRLGLAAVKNTVFIHPADIPGPGVEIYRALADALPNCASDVLRPAYRGRPGHPILLNQHAQRKVLDAEESSNLKEVLKTCSCFDIEVDSDLILRDFNTRDEYFALVARLDSPDIH